MPEFFRVLMVILAAAFAVPALAAEFHVGVDGDDGNAGTRNAPFQTFERARDAVREHRAAEGLGDGVTVILHGGRHHRTGAFNLGEDDSGEPGAPVVYKAASGETVYVDGGHVIEPDAFAPVTDEAVLDRLLEAVRDDVVQADLKALGIDEYGQFGPRGWGRPDIPGPMELFLDGAPQRVARWPNEGHIPLGEVLQMGGEPRAGDDSGESGVFKYNTDRAERWTEAEDLFISGLFGVSWAHDTIGITEIDTEAGTFTTDGPHHYGFRQPGMGNIQTHYYAVNLLEEIEQPGEYYIDRDNGMLYFLPPYPLEHSFIQLSAADTPLVLLENVSHVHFEGLIFENARAQGLRIVGGEGVRVAGCTMRALGRLGVGVVGGHRHSIISCNIHHTGRGGIRLTGGDRASLEPAEHLARNCDIHSYNRWIQHYNPAVSVNGVGSRAEHNHMHRALHQAIVFGGNDHEFVYNEIHHVVQDISDMGSIYVGRNPTFAGNVIRHNFFHHLFDFQEGGHGVQAIFFDDDTIYVAKVFGNVFYRTGSTGVIKFHGGGGASIANNIVIDGPQFVEDVPGGVQGIERAVSKMKTDEPHGHGFPAMVEDMNIGEDPYRSRYPYLYETYAEGYNEGTPQWNNFVVDEDLSAFVDPEELDFRLREDAPALEMVAEDVHDRVYGVDGEDIPFEPIPFDEIGLKIDEHRTSLGPAPFHKLGPGNATETSAERIQLWWAPSHNADVYHVRVATDADMEDVVIERETRDNWVFIDDLAVDRAYYWQVEAEVNRSRSNRGRAAAEEGPWRLNVSAE